MLWNQETMTTVSTHFITFLVATAVPLQNVKKSIWISSKRFRTGRKQKQSACAVQWPSKMWHESDLPRLHRGAAHLRRVPGVLPWNDVKQFHVLLFYFHSCLSAHKSECYHVLPVRISIWKSASHHAKQELPPMILPPPPPPPPQPQPQPQPQQ